MNVHIALVAIIPFIAFLSVRALSTFFYLGYCSNYRTNEDFFNLKGGKYKKYSSALNSALYWGFSKNYPPGSQPEIRLLIFDVLIFFPIGPVIFTKSFALRLETADLAYWLCDENVAPPMRKNVHKKYTVLRKESYNSVRFWQYLFSFHLIAC